MMDLPNFAAKKLLLLCTVGARQSEHGFPTNIEQTKHDNIMKTSIAFAVAAAMIAFAPAGLQAQSRPSQGEVTENLAKTGSATGTILQVMTSSMQVKDTAGMTHMFIINADTKFGTVEDPKKITDFPVGEKVLVKYELKDDKMVATNVFEAPVDKTTDPTVKK